MIGTIGFVGERLSEALEARGLTSAALANMLNLTPVAISQYIKGKTSPRPEVMSAICEKLNFPESFFRRPIRRRTDDAQEVFWRSFSSATKTARTQSARRFRWLKQIVEYLGGYLEFPAVNLPFLDIPPDILTLRSEDIENYASTMRARWNLADGPISDIILALENNGIVVSKSAMGTEALDAFSQWSDTDKLPYIVLATDKQSAVRSRYDAGHELGHLVLHRRMNDTSIRTPAIHKEMERQAFRFSSAFLLPSKPFLDELWAPTLDAFRALKDRWKVSVGVMIKRCEELQVIDEEQTRRLWINYNRRGWRGSEPLDEIIPMEKTRLLRRSIELLIREGGKTTTSILEDLSLPDADVEELCELPAGFFSRDYESVTLMPRFKDDSYKPSGGTTGGSVVPFARRFK